MRFRDIPQFTRDGAWECDYDITRVVEQIEDWNKEFGVNLEPDFQRGHVWSEKQQIAWLEFLLKGGKTSRILYFNNPNWGKYDGKDDMVCVDGLQRFTAIKRFVNNEIKVFGHYFNEYEDSVRLVSGIKINVNNLQTRKEVLQWYIDFNSGGTIHTTEEIDRVKKLLEEEDLK